MEVNFTEFFGSIFFSVFSNTISVLGVNFNIAILTGFLGAIIFSVFPTLIGSSSFVGFLKNFIMFFIVFSFLGYTSTVFIDTKSSAAEVNDYLKLDYIERNCGYPNLPFP